MCFQFLKNAVLGLYPSTQAALRRERKPPEKKSEEGQISYEAIFQHPVREGVLMRLNVFLVGAAFFLASCSKQKQSEPVIQVVRAGVVEEIQPTAEER